MADTLHKGATSVHLFIIRNKKVDKVRMLYWEDDGFWFLYN
ncbi:IS66 family insertion sequence element accessory protein TnpB [Microbulbifer sp. DLAB2-AA]